MEWRCMSWILIHIINIRCSCNHLICILRFLIFFWYSHWQTAKVFSKSYPFCNWNPFTWKKTSIHSNGPHILWEAEHWPFLDLFWFWVHNHKVIRDFHHQSFVQTNHMNSGLPLLIIWKGLFIVMWWSLEKCSVSPIWVNCKYSDI